MEGFWSFIINRTPKQSASLVTEKHIHWWIFFVFKFKLCLRSGLSSPTALTDLDATKRLGIFSFQPDEKTSPLHSSFSFSSPTSWPLLFSSPSLLSFWTLLTPFVIFSPYSITEHCFDFPGSAYRPACRTAGRIPGL